MTTRWRAYDPERDFGRVREFLVRTYLAFGTPSVNWGIERWNYARYFVAPMLGAAGTEPGVPPGALRAIRMWEEMIGLWEDERGRIVGVANIEHPDPEHRGFGEIFLQRHPEHPELLDEMLAYAEDRFRDPRKNRVFIFVHETDAALRDAVARRGYAEKPDVAASHLEIRLDDLPAPVLPPGFAVRTMAEEDDIDRRRELLGRAFNHPDPADWPSAFAYRELQRAPDYRREHDLVVVAPDGSYTACCIIWHDAENRIGHLEPVGTHPDFRRRGLARAVVLHGLRTLAALGATRVPMESDAPLYEAIGFRKVGVSRPWVKAFGPGAG
ncbi:GNAT family N-acetyltransferase [Candidatus Bipolaricaulota bacterium]|nr:GNAT family N-acetyltransferase [Candidatus Bipolaricaulota bacterium]